MKEVIKYRCKCKKQLQNQIKKKTEAIYLDNSSTSKMTVKSVQVLKKASEIYWGNANSKHHFGKKCNDMLNSCTNIIAESIRVKSEEIIYTSGATEGNNMLINNIPDLSSILTIESEHDSIINTLKKQTDRFTVDYIKINKDGTVNIYDLEKKIKTVNCTHVIIQIINSETGIIQNIKEISRVCHENGVLLFTDATQAIGHIDIDAEKLNIDFMTCSAHKFNGPKGIGFVYVKSGNDLRGFITGGHQQNGLRAGTIDIPSICAMTIALYESIINIKKNNTICLIYRKYILDRLKKYNNFHINGSLKQRLSNNLNFYIDNIEGEYIFNELDKRGIYVSQGSTCSIGYNEFSKTLLSMGCSKWVAENSIRMCFDPNINKMEEIKYVTDVLEEIIKNKN